MTTVSGRALVVEHPQDVGVRVPVVDDQRLAVPLGDRDVRRGSSPPAPCGRRRRCGTCPGRSRRRRARAGRPASASISRSASSRSDSRGASFGCSATVATIAGCSRATADAPARRRHVDPDLHQPVDAGGPRGGDRVGDGGRPGAAGGRLRRARCRGGCGCRAPGRPAARAPAGTRPGGDFCLAHRCPGSHQRRFPPRRPRRRSAGGRRRRSRSRSAPCSTVAVDPAGELRPPAARRAGAGRRSRCCRSGGRAAAPARPARTRPGTPCARWPTCRRENASGGRSVTLTTYVPPRRERGVPRRPRTRPSRRCRPSARRRTRRRPRRRTRPRRHRSTALAGVADHGSRCRRPPAAAVRARPARPGRRRVRRRPAREPGRLAAT